MDIVLTIPKKQYARHEAILIDVMDGMCVLLWVFKRKPKIEIGDKVYFVRNSRVEYYMTVRRKRGFREQTLVMDTPVWLTEIIEARGFQGFRYKWWDDKLIVHSECHNNVFYHIHDDNISVNVLE